jgi:hypothetical protein
MKITIHPLEQYKKFYFVLLKKIIQTIFLHNP